MSQLEKFEYYLYRFSDVYHPPFTVEEDETKLVFETSIGFDIENQTRTITYCKTTQKFIANNHKEHGFSYLPEPFDETEQYEIGDECISEYYMYPLAVCTGVNINLCMFSDYLFCLKNKLQCKYKNKMQEICENIGAHTSNMYVFNLIPNKFRSKKLYENILRHIPCGKKIMKSMPKEYYDEELALLIMKGSMINCGKYVIGKEQYDSYLQYIPSEYHESVNNKYKKYVYSSEKKGCDTVRMHYTLYETIGKKALWSAVVEKLKSSGINCENMDERKARYIYSALLIEYDSDVGVLLNDYLSK